VGVGKSIVGIGVNSVVGIGVGTGVGVGKSTVGIGVSIGGVSVSVGTIVGVGVSGVGVSGVAGVTEGVYSGVSPPFMSTSTLSAQPPCRIRIPTTTKDNMTVSNTFTVFPPLFS